MAKVSAGAAYKELTKVGDYLSPNINAAADRLSRQGMQQKQLNADAKEAADKRLDDAYAGINVPELVTTATGFESRDDVARDFASTATQRSMEYAEKAREAASNGDWVAMNNLKGKIKRIEGDFKNTVNDEKILGDLFTSYREKYQKDEVDDDDWLNFAESMEKFNYRITLDENDNKVVTAIELDDDGQPVLGEDGEPKVMTKKWSDIVNQRDRPYEVVRLEDKEGKKGLIGDMLSTMGKRKYDDATGMYITTTQTWDEQAEKQFMGKVKALEANDRMMYSLLKQATGGDILEKKNSKLPKGQAEANNKIVEDFLREQVRGGYGEESKASVRSMTVEEKMKEDAKDRAVTMRGQDINKENQEADNAMAAKRLALDEWIAKNPKAAGKITKEETKKAENAGLVVKFHDLAKKVGALGEQANDDAVQKVFDESGLGFMIDTDWQLWFQDNQFDIGSVTDIKNKDTFRIIKGLAKKAGIEMKDTDIKEAIKTIQESGMTSEGESPKPTAQELIDKYKN